jgi:GNAT superfamily N-acetyltransferase
VAVAVNLLLRRLLLHTRDARRAIPSTTHLPEIGTSERSPCEQTFAARGLDVAFKSQHPNGELDAHLADQGYQCEGCTSVYMLDDLGAISPPEYENVIIETEPSDNWLAALCALNESTSQHLPTVRQMLYANANPQAFVRLQENGATIALGVAALERGYVGIYHVVTAAHKRRQGIGTQLMRHLVQWAKDQGAQHAYLQVMNDNPPALYLYAKMGFRAMYDYWYRVKHIH